MNKSGPLNPEEWEIMKSHVIFGAKILDPLTPLASVRKMVLHHHEFFDGSGYPEALSGNNIPLGARIIAVADAYDTITSDRTYKKASPRRRRPRRTRTLRQRTIRRRRRRALRPHHAPIAQSHHRSGLTNPQFVIRPVIRPM